MVFPTSISREYHCIGADFCFFFVVLEHSVKCLGFLHHIRAYLSFDAASFDNYWGVLARPGIILCISRVFYSRVFSVHDDG